MHFLAVYIVQSVHGLAILVDKLSWSERSMLSDWRQGHLYTVNLLADEKLTQANESRSPCQWTGKWMCLWDTLVYFGIKNSESLGTMWHPDCWMSDKNNLGGDEEHSRNLELIILWGREDTMTTCNSVSNHEVQYAHHFLLYVFSFCERWLESVLLCLLSESLLLLAPSSAGVFDS